MTHEEIYAIVLNERCECEWNTVHSRCLSCRLLDAFNDHKASSKESPNTRYENMTPEELQKLQDERCECVLSIRGGYRCRRCQLIDFHFANFQKRTPKCSSHEVAEIPGDYYATDQWRSDGAYCMHCGADLGWYCPKSPDHRCEYSETSDSCDYCGMPDERK